MEDKLRVEAKNLVEQIKATRNKLKSGNGDSDEFVLQGSSGTQAPQLLTEPKRRRLLKGRFVSYLFEHTWEFILFYVFCSKLTFFFSPFHSIINILISYRSFR